MFPVGTIISNASLANTIGGTWSTTTDGSKCGTSAYCYGAVYYTSGSGSATADANSDFPT